MGAKMNGWIMESLLGRGGEIMIRPFEETSSIIDAFCGLVSFFFMLSAVKQQQERKGEKGEKDKKDERERERKREGQRG